MIPHFLTTLWNASAPAIGNHLWQSTLFACIAALLTLAFRNNRAGTRYALWLAASLKFLIPFALLINIGGRLASYRVAGNAPAALYSAVEQFSQPFAYPVAPAVPHFPAAAISQSPAHFLPILLPIWLCGSILVLGIWFARWRRISAAVRRATPLAAGSESEIFSRLQSNDGLRNPIEIVSSATSIEPGLFGIFRPVLLWPQSMSARLTEAQTEAILAHELCHARRRDNLTAALHMFVEAAFWFHPMTWWLGARLVDDRERACDEQVVDSGREPQIYAESILKVCEFCVESPLSCVPGVSGADLKRRITRIMARRGTRELNFPRKLLLTAACVLAIAAPILAGAFSLSPRRVTAAAQSSTTLGYASVSIAPHVSGGDNVMLMFGVGEFDSKNASLQQVMRVAYGVEDDRIIGAPSWLSSEKYDVVAKEANPEGGNPQKDLDQDAGEQKRMLQSMLAERLKLAVHRETREIPTYALIIAAGGPKLEDSDPGAPHPEWHKARDGVARWGVWMDGNAVVGQGIGVAPLLFHLSRVLHRTVVDETGLSGTYDFRLKLPDGVGPGIDNPVPPASADPTIVLAVEQQLGLKLELRTVPLEVIVIDHVERPSTSQAQNATDTPSPQFESVALKLNQAGTDSLRTGNGIIRQRMKLVPGEFDGANNSLREMIRVAYKVKDYQIFGAPDWVSTDLYDVDAKARQSISTSLQNLPDDQRQAVSARMLQQLLADRFQLQSHFETKQLPAYSLVVSDPGKLREAGGNCDSPLSPRPKNLPEPEGIPCGGISNFPPGELTGNEASITQLVSYLSEITGRSVQDKTQRSGAYDIKLRWTPQYRLDQMPPLDHSEPSNPSLLAALQTQLGLKLEPQSSPVRLLVIDQVQKPTQN
jgi:bla regulator protein BlaR1